jgi:hypothetical protein
MDNNNKLPAPNLPSLSPRKEQIFKSSTALREDLERELAAKDKCIKGIQREVEQLKTENASLQERLRPSKSQISWEAQTFPKGLPQWLCKRNPDGTLLPESEAILGLLRALYALRSSRREELLYELLNQLGKLVCGIGHLESAELASALAGTLPAIKIVIPEPGQPIDPSWVNAKPGTVKVSTASSWAVFDIAGRVRFRATAR